MKRALKYFAAIALMLSANATFGQSHFTETISRWIVDPAYPNSDFWIAPAQNDDPADKIITIYITSPNNTTAYVNSGGITKAVQIPSFGVGTFNVPLSWEMQSSGIVENKGIHVYDPTDYITVCLKSSSTYTSDGMVCIPAAGLGTDYVVAGYESYFSSADSSYDYPSEFTIAAEEDSTIIEITPSCDLRQSDSFPMFNNIVKYPQGRPLEVTLNRGQCIQYQAALAKDNDNYDVTGTIIHSNFPVAVVGGSMLSNIPPDFPNGNYICDMIPPVKMWGKTYYSINNMQPQGMPGHDYSLYCMISSVPNQTIYRHDCTTGDHTEAVLGPAFDHLYVEESETNKWYSDQPFLLVQYFNSNTYPDGVAGNGSPSEVVIYPKESFRTFVQFITPPHSGVQSPFDNNANIIVNINDTANVKLDKISISNYSHECLDDTFAMYLATHLTSGEHFITSDSGCGVYVYDDGYQAGQFSWSGVNFSKPFDPKDTITPDISFTSGSSCVHAAISDTGTGLANIILDSTSNLSFAADTGFVPNSGHTNSFADICVIDTTLTGYLSFSVSDLAGQGFAGIITYTPSALAVVAQESQTKVCATLTPNPAAKSVALNFSLSQTANVAFELSAIDGRKVFNWKADAQSIGEHIQMLDISTLPTGSYIYRFAANGQTQSGKLIINR